MIFFESSQGLCCRPQSEIASIAPAFPDRFRVDCHDGCVGYCYEPADRGPLGRCQYSDKESFDSELLRRIEKAENKFHLTLVSGETLIVMPKWVPAVRSFLQLDQYKPQPECLTRYFLREYPFEIIRAPVEVLKREFPSARLLIANIIWQTLERIRQGLGRYGDTYSGYFYHPLFALLERAGWMNEKFDKAAAQELFQRILGRMVGDDQLFDYHDLAFKDDFINLREFGSRHPHVILVIEKLCLSDAGIEAARQCGVSWIVTGGVSRLIAVEFFLAAFRKVYQGDVTVIDFGDFDPGGWLNGRSFVKHLARYDTHCASGPHYLTRPELFTQEEIDFFSRPLTPEDGRIDEWLAESGGIHGQPRGIHADWLQPPERVQQALQKLLEKLSGEG